MRLFKSNRNKSTHQISNNIFPEGLQHPDLPLSPNPQARSSAPSPRPREQNLNRASSVSDRFSSGYAGDRRSIAVEPGFDHALPFLPDDAQQQSPQLSAGLRRAQTVSRRDGASANEVTASPQPSPLPLWSPDFSQLPTPNEQPEPLQQEFLIEGDAPMSQYPPTTPGKSSSDSGQSSAALDRWSQRRLQRLNTEQGFREQRQGGQGILSPPASLGEQSGYSSTGVPYPTQAEAAPQLHQQAQPHPSQQPTYHSARTGPASHPNAGLAIQTQPISSSQRTSSLQNQENPQAYVHPQQYSPPDSASQYAASQENIRPATLAQSRSYNSQQQAGDNDSTSMSSSNNGTLPAPKAVRSGNANRQSVHNGLNSREGSALTGQNGGQQGVPAFNASVVPTASQGQAYQPASQQKGDVGRVTPQPTQSSEDMSEEDVNQLIKDHKELREKYTKVKKYYFEKEDQVKQLQNSLAHQRLSQSRTSLDDSEYTTRFNRLDGLVAQLAFSIRKSWRSIPSWLVSSVNKDAVATGKQEMTAAGRAFISCWLVEEVFDKYFHPDLEPTLSAQLKSIQKNIRRFAPPTQTAEEEEHLTSKVVNWRLATLEGLQEALRSPQCPANRAQLTDALKEMLVAALAVHLQDPPPSDLEGGVHMIIELVVSIAIHLPLESRDVVIEYFMPGYSIMQDQMKLETGIPPLTMSIADDAAERASMKSAASDVTDNTESSNTHNDQPSKKRSVLNALTGKNTKDRSAEQQQRKHAGAGGSSSSLNRPDSSQGMKHEQPPRVRMAAGIGVQVRQRGVLVKAPVFATS